MRLSQSRFARTLPLAAAMMLVSAPAAIANTIDVTSTVDTSSLTDCSLRRAIIAANTDATSGGCPAGSGADTIVLHTATYTLSKAGRNEDNDATGDLDIRSSMTITGDGQEKSIIDAAGIDRAIEIPAATATVVLKNLTVTGGNLAAEAAQPPVTGSNQFQDVTGAAGTPGSSGGGISAVTNLTIDHVTVRDNTAGGGGAGANAKHTNHRSATGGAGGQGGDGGGIANYATLKILDSRITGNTAGAGGNGGSGNGSDAADFLSNDIGAGTGGTGGTGGRGGGIYTRYEVPIERSVIASNHAGTGGSGGSAVGGDQYDPNFTTGTAPPSGGVANGGAGGPGGNGGGIAQESFAINGPTSISETTVSRNHAGNGGPGQTAKGGKAAAQGGIAGKATGGSGGSGGSGGGVVVIGGAVVVERSTLVGNDAGNGSTGAFATAGQNGPPPSVPPGGQPSPTTPAPAKGGRGGDGGSGGGFESTGSGTKTVTDATVDSNESGSGGQGGGATGTLNGGNGGGAGSGGGLDGHITPIAITRATLSSNDAGLPGNGVAGGGKGSNGLGSALWGGGSTKLTGSIVTDNAAVPPSRCIGTIADGGSNIDYPFDTACPGATVDPQLGALADNGGLTQTRALPPGSPAIDLFAACDLATDQRGVAPTGPKCDAGAYEFALPAVAGVRADVDGSSVAFGAQVTPNAGSATVAFEYGKDESYGSAKTQTIGGGVATPTAVTATADGLDPGTVYHFRVRATTNAGTTTTTDGTFRTADAPAAGGGAQPQGAGGGSGSNPPPNAPANGSGTGTQQPLVLSGATFPSAKVAPSLSRGYGVSFTAPSTGVATLVLSASGGDARGLRTVVARTVKVASGSKRVTKAGKVKVTAKFTRKARSKLRHKRKLKLTAVLTFRDAHGRTATSTKKVTLKR